MKRWVEIISTGSDHVVEAWELDRVLIKWGWEVVESCELAWNHGDYIFVGFEFVYMNVCIYIEGLCLYMLK